MSNLEVVAIPAENTVLSISDSALTTFTQIANILDVEPPGGVVASVSTTGLNSATKTSRPGKIPDSGSIAFRIAYNPNQATHQTLTGLLAVPAIRKFKVVYNDGDTTPANDQFLGYITEFKPDKAEDEKNIEADLTVVITGAVTRTPGTP
jgi:hypothetical protein